MSLVAQASSLVHEQAGTLALRPPAPPGRRDLVPPTHQHIAEAAQRIENRAFILAATGAGVGQDAPGQARERQRLQPDFARTSERGEEQSFPAEDRVFEAADEAN